MIKTKRRRMPTTSDVAGESTMDVSGLAPSKETKSEEDSNIESNSNMPTVESMFCEPDPIAKVREYLNSIPKVYNGTQSAPSTSSVTSSSIVTIDRNKILKILYPPNTPKVIMKDNATQHDNRWQKTRSMLSSDATQYPSSSSTSSRSDVSSDPSADSVVSAIRKVLPPSVPIRPSASNILSATETTHDEATQKSNGNATTVSKQEPEPSTSFVTASASMGTNSAMLKDDEIIDETGNNTPDNAKRPNWIRCPRRVDTGDVEEDYDIIPANGKRNKYVQCELIRQVSSDYVIPTKVDKTTQTKTYNKRIQVSIELVPAAPQERDAEPMQTTRDQRRTTKTKPVAPAAAVDKGFLKYTPKYLYVNNNLLLQFITISFCIGNFLVYRFFFNS